MSWRLDPKKSGLLIVDLQEKLVPSIHGHERIVKKACDAVRVAKLFSLPIYVTEHVVSKLGPTVAPLKALLDGVTVLPKTDFSCWSALPSDLPKTILVAGIETHVCVRQTVYDLRQREKVVYLLGDAIGSRHPMDHEIGLTEMRQDRVLVTSVESVAFELQETAGGERFKSLLSIVK